MNGRSPFLPAALSILAGIVSWELVRHLGGNHREAWDDPVYWQFSYLSLLVAAFLLGAIWRERPWRWGASIMAGQAVWSLGLAIVMDGVPNLFPLGLVMFALLALPLIGASYLGAWIGRAMSGAKQAGT
jgi:peptidoglycan/LPS O-acetylase OafA/YrhL